MFLLSPRRSVALATGALTTLLGISTMAGELPCPSAAPCGEFIVAQQEPSWIFRRSTYSHDPYTHARVAQYMRTPPVEPLDDERIVTSRYRRSRTNLRGADGSVDTYYEVQQWGNGRGGIDAEWERFHDAWKESFLQGGYYNQRPSYGRPWYGATGGYGGYEGFRTPNYGYGHPGYGYPGSGYGDPWHGGGPNHGGRHPDRDRRHHGDDHDGDRHRGNDRPQSRR